MKGRILIFSIVGCPHCLRAKNTFSKLGLDYTDVSVDQYKAEVGVNKFFVDSGFGLLSGRNLSTTSRSAIPVPRTVERAPNFIVTLTQ